MHKRVKRYELDVHKMAKNNVSKQYWQKCIKRAKGYELALQNGQEQCEQTIVSKVQKTAKSITK